MKVLILEDHGIYRKGNEVEMAMAKGQQWINGGFAEFVPDAPKAKPKANLKAEPKKEVELEDEPVIKKAKKAKKTDD